MATQPEERPKGVYAPWLTLGIASLALLVVPVTHVAAQSGNDTSQAFLEKLAARGIPVASVMAIHRTKQYVLVDTHVNPSAGRLYVLSKNAERVVTEIPGVGTESGRTIAFPIVFDRPDGSGATSPHQVVVTCRGVGTKRARCTEQAR